MRINRQIRRGNIRWHFDFALKEWVLQLRVKHSSKIYCYDKKTGKRWKNL